MKKVITTMTRKYLSQRINGEIRTGIYGQTLYTDIYAEHGIHYRHKTHEIYKRLCYGDTLTTICSGIIDGYEKYIYSRYFA